MKKVECPLWGRDEFLPLVEELKYHSVLFKMSGKGSRRSRDGLVRWPQ